MIDMASKNEITGDSLTSKVNNDAYNENFDKIFGVKKKEPYVPPPLPEELQHLNTTQTSDKMGT